MNLWLRLLALLATFRFRPGLDAPFAASLLHFRVWPHDLDTSAHMNNGRYWQLMDLGRTDLMLRTGLWRAVLRHRWVPVVNAGAIRFRRELRLFARFTLETRIVCWTEERLVIQHRVLARSRDGGESVAAVALVRAGVYDRRSRSFVPMARLLGELGIASESPLPPPDVEAFLEADAAMRSAGAAN